MTNDAKSSTSYLSTYIHTRVHDCDSGGVGGRAEIFFLLCPCLPQRYPYYCYLRRTILIMRGLENGETGADETSNLGVISKAISVHEQDVII